MANCTLKNDAVVLVVVVFNTGKSNIMCCFGQTVVWLSAIGTLYTSAQIITRGFIAVFCRFVSF